MSNIKIFWHPKPEIIAVVKSKSAVPIRLTVERWNHTLKCSAREKLTVDQADLSNLSLQNLKKISSS